MKNFFIFLKKAYIRSKQVVSTLVLICFGRTPFWHTLKPNRLTFQTVDREIWLIFIFYGTAWDKLFRHILRTIFQEKYFSCYILVTGQILDIFRNICAIIICCTVCDTINFEINNSFLIKTFFYITKKSKQKCKYLMNEQNF